MEARYERQGPTLYRGSTARSNPSNKRAFQAASHGSDFGLSSPEELRDGHRAKRRGPSVQDMEEGAKRVADSL